MTLGALFLGGFAAPPLVPAARADTEIRPDSAIYERYGIPEASGLSPSIPMPNPPLFRFSGADFGARWEFAGEVGARFVLRGRVDGCAVAGSVVRDEWNTGTDYKERREFALEGRYDESGTLEIWFDNPSKLHTHLAKQPAGTILRFRFESIAVGDGCGSAAFVPPAIPVMPEEMPEEMPETAPGAAPPAPAPAPAAPPVPPTTPEAPPTFAGEVSPVPATAGPDGPIPTDDPAPASPGLVATGSVLAGGVAMVGAGLLLLGSGMGPRDVVDGVRELFGVEAEVAPEAPPPAPEDNILRLQREVVDRIKREGWDDVTSQEYDLVREAPQALRDELRQGVVAEEIEGYQRGWKDNVTTGLKVTQSGADYLAGMCATAHPTYGVYYTYTKNVAGSLSQGVADWAWGRNDKGLLRNLGEGLARGTLKAGAEIAVDAVAGKLVDNPVAGYFAGQAGKYAVGQATDGFLETTSPLEKDALDAVVGTVSNPPPASPDAPAWLASPASPGMPAPAPYMSHHEVY